MSFEIKLFVSVIIPTRNRQDKLIRAVKSVATQTYQNVELVVVDDGSDQFIDYESLKNIWNQYRSSDFLKIIHQKQSNANVARNRGADESMGSYFIFLDSDDLLAPWAIENRISLSYEYKGIICSNAECFNEFPGDLKKLWNLPIDGYPLDRFLYLDFPWQTSGPMWPRNVFYSIGKFDERLPSWQDWELFVRSLISGIEFSHFSSCDYFVNISGDDKTSKRQYMDLYHLKEGILTMDRLVTSLSESCFFTEKRIYNLQIIKYCLVYCMIENHGYKTAIEVIKNLSIVNKKISENKLIAHRLSCKLPSFLKRKMLKAIWGDSLSLDNSENLLIKFSIPELLASNKTKSF